MFTVEDYISAITTNLKEQSDILIENLRNCLNNNFSSNIGLLDFTAYVEPTRFELSIVMFTMDKEANEVFKEDVNPDTFAGSIEVLQEIEYYQLKDEQLDLFFNFYEENEETIMPFEQKLLVEWFSNCWEEAGGNTMKLPVYFAIHDDDKSFDLKKQIWVDDEQKWS